MEAESMDIHEIIIDKYGEISAIQSDLYGAVT
jgi:hypothetical protein